MGDVKKNKNDTSHTFFKQAIIMAATGMTKVAWSKKKNSYAN